MKTTRLVGLVLGLTTLFAGCDRPGSALEAPSTPEAIQAEVERKVQERLIEERLKQVEEQMKNQQLDLAGRERLLADREQLLADQQRAIESERARLQTAAATPAAPSPQMVGVAEPQSAPAADPGPVRETALRGIPVDSEIGGVASYEPFYDRLDPYGDWIDTSNYGYVWRPYDAVRVSGWRPYSRGSWAYSDYGWTWVSDESYGWATYHYGRWIETGPYGWCWVPGSEWGPSWVSWEENDDYIGWAPLPPQARFGYAGYGSGAFLSISVGFGVSPSSYCFVPVRDFGYRDIGRYVVPRERNVTIINNTKNVTKIVYNQNKKVVINEGPGFERVNRRSAERLRTLRVEREAGLPAAGVSGTRVDGDVLRVSSPKLPPEGKKGRAQPKKIKASAGEVAVVNVPREAQVSQPAAATGAAATGDQGGDRNPARHEERVRRLEEQMQKAQGGDKRRGPDQKISEEKRTATDGKERKEKGNAGSQKGDAPAQQELPVDAPLPGLQPAVATEGQVPGTQAAEQAGPGKQQDQADRQGKAAEQAQKEKQKHQREAEARQGQAQRQGQGQGQGQADRQRNAAAQAQQDPAREQQSQIENAHKEQQKKQREAEARQEQQRQARQQQEQADRQRNAAAQAQQEQARQQQSRIENAQKEQRKQEREAEARQAQQRQNRQQQEQADRQRNAAAQAQQEQARQQQQQAASRQREAGSGAPKQGKGNGRAVQQSSAEASPTPEDQAGNNGRKKNR